MFVKRAPGLSYPVLDPFTKVVLPPEGKEVTSNLRWWHRRIAEGDVVEVTAADAKIATAKVEATEKVEAAKLEAAKAAPSAATKQGTT